MQKLPGNFPYGIIPVAGGDITLAILFVMEYLHLFQIVLVRNLAFIVAALLTLFVLFSPMYFWASLYIWRHKNSHNYSYDEHGLYQDGQQIVSWKETQSVMFQQKFDSWYKLGSWVWAWPAYNQDGTSKGKIRRRLSGSITFCPKRGFGISQVEVTIPITVKAAPVSRLYRKMKTFVESSGSDAVLNIRMK